MGGNRVYYLISFLAAIVLVFAFALSIHISNSLNLVIPGPQPDIPCIVPTNPVHTSMVNYTGLGFSDISGISNYIIKPGMSGEIKYVVYQSNNSMSNGMLPNRSLGSNAAYTQLYYYQKRSPHVGSTFVYPNPLYNPDTNTSYGIKISYSPTNDNLVGNETILVTATITVEPNAPKGTYWMNLGPGVCYGWAESLLTVGSTAFNGSLNSSGNILPP